MARKYARTDPPEPRSVARSSAPRLRGDGDNLSDMRRRSSRLLIVVALLLGGALVLSRTASRPADPPPGTRSADALIGEERETRQAVHLSMTLYFDDGSTLQHEQTVQASQAAKLDPGDWVRVEFAPGGGSAPPRITRFYFDTVSSGE